MKWPEWFEESPDELLDWLVLPVASYAIGLIIGGLL
jgi:hypothetical protein